MHQREPHQGTGRKGSIVSAVPSEESYLPDVADSADVPGWSGKFIEYVPRTFGVVAVHVDDLRTHRFPRGWHPANDEPIYIDDVEIWTLLCEDADLSDDSPFVQLDCSELERKNHNWRIQGLLVTLAVSGASLVINEFAPMFEAILGSVPGWTA